MPREYGIFDVTRFAYRYEWWGENLRNLSHPQTCVAMRLLSGENQVSVSDIHEELTRLDISRSNLSTFLKHLRERGLVYRRGRLYELVNNYVYKRVFQAAGRLKNYLENDVWSELDFRDISSEPLNNLAPRGVIVSDLDVASTAKVFSDLIYEEASNYLVHILLKKKRTFNEIVDIYQTNHGYISPDRIRYYLSSRNLILFEKQFQAFKQENRRYGLTEIGSTVHKSFDDALSCYMRDSEIWMEGLWNKKSGELVNKTTAIVHPTDPFFKVLRLLAKSRIVLVQAETVIGVITVQDALNKMSEELGNPGWWTYITARQAMKPIQTE